MYPPVNYGISLFLIGNTSSKGPFSIVMLDYRSICVLSVVFLFQNMGLTLAVEAICWLFGQGVGFIGTAMPGFNIKSCVA